MPIRLFAILVAGAASIFASAADPAPITNNCRLTIVSDMAMDKDGKTQAFSSTGGFGYVWKSAGKERSLVVQEMSVKAKIDGKEKIDMKMSRAGIFGTAEGMKLDRKYEDLPEAEQRMIREVFESPLCKLEIDESGKEVKRTMLAGPSAKTLVDTGIVANAAFFHPPYYADKNEWETDRSINGGQVDATGKLAYKKIAGGKGGQAVKVSGTLKADNVKLPNGVTLKESKYVVTGTQTYDPSRKEWVAGNVDVDLTFVLAAGEKEVVRAKGKMAVTFEMLPAKK